MTPERSDGPNNGLPQTGAGAKVRAGGWCLRWADETRRGGSKAERFKAGPCLMKECCFQPEAAPLV